MFYLIATIHVIVSLFLIVVVLLQSGKAADLAGAFGGLGSQTVFGPRGSATVLTRATTISAIIFMLTSLTLSLTSTGGPSTGGSGNDILDKMSGPSTSAPATPGKEATPGAPTTVPGGIEVTPQVNGQPGQTQILEIPGATQQPSEQKQK